MSSLLHNAGEQEGQQSSQPVNREANREKCKAVWVDADFLMSMSHGVLILRALSIHA